MSDEQRRLVYDNQGNPVMDIDDEIEREERELALQEENRLREATAIQVYPLCLQMFTQAKKSPINGQLQGVNIDVVQAAKMAWEAAEALAVVGRLSDKGRAFAPDQPKPSAPTGIIQ